LLTGSGARFYIEILKIVPRTFYAGPPVAVARHLLGKILVRRIGKSLLAGRIVEVEAYTADDPASHAFRGRTHRNRALFAQVGRAYIYQTHGQYCLNVVAHDGRQAGGVLIRSLEPIEGLDMMRRFRARRVDARRLASGPGNLTRAMRIDMKLYGADLSRNGPIYIADDGAPRPKVRRTVRIGVTAARDKLRRFVVDGDPSITRPRLGL
jgi:DNA-3-methyladenine glycosylase